MMNILKSYGLEKYMQGIQESMLSSLGGYYICNMEQKFLCVNDAVANVLDFSSVDKLLGRNLENTIYEDFKDLCYENDQQVYLANKTLIFYEYFFDASNQFKVIATHKRPFYYKDKLVGIEGATLEFDLKSLKMPSEFSNRLCFININQNKSMDLTLAQRRVLYYVMHGYPAIKVADILSISKRTVQNHLATIKAKVECDSVKDLLINTLVL